MGKQQPERGTAMSAPPPRKRKKKGRPSLLDLQKRSLRLEMQQEAPAQRRPSTRRNPGPGSADDSDGPAPGGGRRERKLRLVTGLVDDSGKGEKSRKATDGRQEPSDSGPTTPLPNNKLLLFVLDRLQKKDTYGVFSEPVDPEELPDYHDIIEHPMDFSTVRKKLDKGAYSNLEQFEDDVFLISSNAMCYNSPDTIYYRQARAIQELAKKDFENLRQDSDASDPEPEPEPEAEPEPEPKPQPRRGRPPNKNNVKQKVGRPPAERAAADFSGSSLATCSNSGRHTPSELDLSQRAMIANVLRASFANQRNEYNWSGERKTERIEDFSGSGSRWSVNGKKPVLMEDSRRSTYYETQPSSSLYELPVSSSYNGTRKLLIPVGFQLQQSYPRSLARFAAQLGPVGWEVASRRIERSLPPGTKFGRGWVGDGETPNTFQPPVLASFSEAMAPLSNIAASDEQPTINSPATMDCAASASHHVGSQPHAVSYASTSIGHRVDSRESPVQQCGSVPQISIDSGGHGIEMKGNHNRHEHPAMQQPVNGFNAVPGAMLFPPAAQLVVNQMQTHTAD
ncbi:hypothetical protein PR202_ga16546 [Eleusine coracana subsp. coracana]|uniref:Bromo domain-containing protein n=1 Tax=Eleusine coracana subsp. coracana TaxID=191504 RepID=A0AAV5CN10_ELECO|nr:hypothetical protein QOZ80_6AG0527110 [Eleusine coracana subsp. coracana]GJM99448.1 hypothetical protein PR202_ga16546 [Eleusine coracana subsp. coracana]